MNKDYHEEYDEYYYGQQPAQGYDGYGYEQQPVQGYEENYYGQQPEYDYDGYGWPSEMYYADEPNQNGGKPEDNAKARRKKRPFLSSFLPWKGDSFGRVVWKLIFIVALIVFITSAVYLGAYFLDTYRTSQLSGDISSKLITDDEDGDIEDIEREYGIILPETLDQKFARLYAENQDTFGWIKIPDTVVDYVVVKGEDNDEYIRSDFYGEYSRHGTVFVDSGCSMESRNIVLYGHHMHDGTMFQPLTMYRTASGYKKAPVVEFDMVNGTGGKYKVFAAFLTNALPSEDNGYAFNYMQGDFSSNGEFMEFIEQIQMRSMIYTGVDVNENDSILTLSTCEYDFNEARLVVVARKVRDGEDETVDTSAAYTRDDARYPQAWYDAKGIENPYAGYEKWVAE